jgi:DNA repair protein RadC
VVKMRDVAKADRPRERLAAKGPAVLSDFELLQALIGSGVRQADVSKIAKDTLKLLRRHSTNLNYEQLARITGLGTAKITELLAAFELSKRYLVEPEQPIIDSSEKVVDHLADIRDKKQEHFVCLTLDGANRLIAKRTITVGTLTSSLVHPREVFADAITDRAASVIVAHNHPSGTLAASPADEEVTARLKQAAALLGIHLADHIVVTKTSFISIA